MAHSPSDSFLFSDDEMNGHGGQRRARGDDATSVEEEPAVTDNEEEEEKILLMPLSEKKKQVNWGKKTKRAGWDVPFARSSRRNESFCS